MPEQAEVAPVEITLAVDNGVVFKKKDYVEGNLAGMSFACPQFPEIETPTPESESSLRDTLNVIIAFTGKGNVVTGLSRLISEINSLFAARVRAYVKALPGIPDFKGNEHEARKFFSEKFPSGIVFSVEDAGEWYPGKREISEKGHLKLAQDAQKAGDLASVIEHALRAIGQTDPKIIKMLVDQALANQPTKQ